MGGGKSTHWWTRIKCNESIGGLNGYVKLCCRDDFWYRYPTHLWSALHRASNKSLTHKIVTITFSCLPFRHAYPFKVSKEDDPKPPFKINFTMSDHDQVCFIENLQHRIPVRIGKALSIETNDIELECTVSKKTVS